MKMVNNYSGPRAGCLVTLLLLTFFTTAHATADTSGIPFTRVFAPQEGLTKSVEQPWRQEICLNGSWQFQPVPLPADYDIKNGAPQLPAPSTGAWSVTPIRIPSPWNINAFGYSGGASFPSYPAEWEKARMGWLRRTFTIPKEWKDQRLILHFEAVCGSAQIFVNGEQVTEHFDNSLPFEVDITDFADRGDENTLLVGVRQASLFDVPGIFGRHTYPSGSPWTRQMIGIWQDVYLRALPPLRIDGIAVRPLLDQGLLELEVTVRNSTGNTRDFQLGGDILPWISGAGKDLLSAPEPRWSLGRPVSSLRTVKGQVGPWMTTKLILRQPIHNELKYWTPESPHLYALVLDVQQDGQAADRCYQRFGWRQWGISGRDVTLNGHPYKLLGESGHLLGVPFMTRRYAWSWYKAIKDLNGNAIRLHANLRPRFYLELADEMGIAILDESEIYASTMEINYYAPETWQRFREHIDAMVLRDRNYPCIFGWSIANEILSAIWWKGIPRKYWPPVIDNVVALADRIKVLDPTRPWISSDGDGDFHGRLPAYIYHYGTPQDWNRQAPKDKPFGIGEGGSMIWGSPAVFSAYSGERSYESRTGMQEGIAIETYGYLTEQRKISAFCSVFTIAGACFEPLPLGMKGAVRSENGSADNENDGWDDSGLSDRGNAGGIVFGPFVEGQPGMQPERISAWATNFNPGYDPALPFYKTTPVFEAVKAAYAPGGPAPCPWDHRVRSSPHPAPPSPVIKKVAFAGDPVSPLKKALESAGIPIEGSATPTDQSGGLFPRSDSHSLLVIDGATMTGARLNEVRYTMQETLQQHGTVFIWVTPDNLTNVNTLLPAAVTLTRTSASALTADREAPETAPLSLADLYFQDQSDKTILSYALGGPLVQQSRQLIRTNTFGRRPSINKKETNGVALIVTETGGGRLLLTSLPPDVRSARRMKLMRNLYANLGVTLSPATDNDNTGFDGGGFLNQALLLGAFQGARYPAILDIDFLGNETQVTPKPGEQVRTRTWTKRIAADNGLFDFFGLGLPGTEDSRARSQGPVLKPEALDANNYLEVTERVSGTNPGTNSVVYLSFWIKAPRVVDSSQMKMLMRSDDGAKVWVNALPVFEEHRVYGPGMTDPKPIPMTFNAGWNHILVKIGQLDGPWIFSAKFESSIPGLTEELRASATGPTTAVTESTPSVASPTSSITGPPNPSVLSQLSWPYGPIRVTADGHYLEYQDGTPFFWLGDTDWELFHRLKKDDISTFLQNRKDKGFNVIQAVILTQKPNAYGDRSMIGNDPLSPVEKYFQLVDWTVEQALEKGMVMALLPTWGDKVTAIRSKDPALFNVDNAYQYGLLLGRRYARYPNIIWIAGGDNPAFVDTADWRPVFRAMIKGLREGSENRQLITYHPWGENSSSLYWHEEKTLDLNMMQTGHRKHDLPGWDWVKRDRTYTPSIPVLDGEPNYEDHPMNWDKKYGYFRDYDVRKQLYRSVFAGACGVTYGHHAVWQFYQKGDVSPFAYPDRYWKEALDRPGAFQAGYLKALMLSIATNERVPDQSMIVQGQGKDGEYMTAFHGGDSSYAMVYLPVGRTITLNTAGLKGKTLRVSWFDPAKGKVQTSAEILRKPQLSFTPPTTGPGKDWVLILKGASQL